MKQQSIALHLYSLTYGYLADLAQTVHDGLAVSVIYVAPPVSLVDQQAAIDNLRAAVLAWGVKGEHGSRQSRNTLIKSRDAVRANLKRLARYCMGVTPDDSNAWGEVGFVTTRTRTPAAIPPKPHGVVQVFWPRVPNLQIKLRWNRPLGVLPRETIVYKVMRSADTDIANAVELATVSKTVYTDTDAGDSLQHYWIVPVNSAGKGHASDECLARGFSLR